MGICMNWRFCIFFTIRSSNLQYKSYIYIYITYIYIFTYHYQYFSGTYLFYVLGGYYNSTRIQWPRGKLFPFGQALFWTLWSWQELKPHETKYTQDRTSFFETIHPHFLLYYIPSNTPLKLGKQGSILSQIMNSGQISSTRTKKKHQSSD